MNDPISEMSEQEIQDSCCKILNIVWRSDASTVGFIIAKLQEWNIEFYWHPGAGRWNMPMNCTLSTIIKHESLQVAFLRTAHALGHWTPPQKVKEEPQTLEERVDALEAKMRVLLPSYGTGNLHAKPQ